MTPGNQPIEALLTETERLLPLIRRLVDDEDAARDVLQETRIAALDRAMPLQRRPGYLRGIAANLARRRRRAEHRRRRHESRATSPIGPPTELLGAERAERLRSVIEAVLALDEPYRTTISLRFLDEKSPAKIAAETGVPVTTVHTRIQRGLDRLRASLTTRYGGRGAWSAALSPLLKTASGSVGKGIGMALKLKVGATAAAIGGIGIVVATMTVLPDEPPPTTEEPPSVEISPRSDPIGPGPAPPNSAARSSVADAAALAVSTPASVSPPLPAGFVTGTVRGEANQPVVGASVDVDVFDASARTWVRSAFRATTDSAGLFRVTGLDPDGPEVGVRVSKPGLSCDRDTLSIGEHGEFVQLPPGVFRGAVVDDVDGAPIANATVSLIRRDPTGRIGAFGLETVTDASGRFERADLRPGAYGVRIVAPSHQPTPGRGAFVVVERGQVTEEVFALNRGRSLRGKVVRADDGRAVAGASVKCGELAVVTTDAGGHFDLTGLGRRAHIEIEAPGLARLTQRVDVPASPSTTISEFRLTETAAITGVVVGAFDDPVVDASAVLLDRGRSDRGTASTGEDGRFELRVDDTHQPWFVQVRRGDAFRRVGPFEVEPGAAADAGRIAIAGPGALLGQVVTERGVPVPSSQVRAESVESVGPTMRSLMVRTTSGPDGRFRFDGLPLGRYRIAADVRGFPIPDDVPVVAVGADAPVYVECRIPTPVTIHGTVVDSDGEPLANAQVSSSGYYVRATSGADGGFELPGIPLGTTIRIDAQKLGYGRTRSPAVAAAIDTPAIRMELPPLLAPITGRVVDRQTRQPIRRFSIRVSPLPDDWRPGKPLRWSRRGTPFQDQRGRFRITMRSVGRFMIDGDSDDGHTCADPVVVEQRADAAVPFVELPLVPGATIRGRAVTPDGDPLARARIEILGSPDRRRLGKSPMFTAENGAFESRGIPPGPVVVRLHHDEWIEAERAVSVNAGATEQIELRAGRDAATLQVGVRSTTGDPVRGATIRLVRADGTELVPDSTRHLKVMMRGREDGVSYDAMRALIHRTDAVGSLTRRFIPPGRYHLHVTHDEFANDVREIRLGRGDRRVEVVLARR